jgi:hypothetical protein
MQVYPFSLPAADKELYRADRCSHERKAVERMQVHKMIMDICRPVRNLYLQNNNIVWYSSLQLVSDTAHCSIRRFMYSLSCAGCELLGWWVFVERSIQDFRGDVNWRGLRIYNVSSFFDHLEPSLQRCPSTWLCIWPGLPEFFWTEVYRMDGRLFTRWKRQVLRRTCPG